MKSGFELVRCYRREELVYEGRNPIGFVYYVDNLSGEVWSNDRSFGRSGDSLGVGWSDYFREYYVCYGFQCLGLENFAVIVTEDKAKELVLKYGDLSLYRKLFGRKGRRSSAPEPALQGKDTTLVPLAQ